MLKKYLRLVKGNPSAAELVRSIWREEKIALNLSGDIERDISRIFELFFNPFRRRSSLRKDIRRLPTTDHFFHLGRTELAFLSKNELLLTFLEGEKEFVSLTPEGVAIASLIDRYGRDFADFMAMDFRYNKRLESVLFEHYRKNSLRNARKLAQELRSEKFLTINQMSITLFLLINGSIGEEKACSIESREVESAIEEIIHAFVRDGRYKRKTVYPFNWYLSTANKVMGDVFYIKSPLYYIYADKVEAVKNRVRKSVKRTHDFHSRWARFLKEYEKQRPILRSHQVSFFSKSEAMKLEQELFIR